MAAPAPTTSTAANDDFFDDAEDAQEAIDDANDDQYEDAYADIEQEQDNDEGVFEETPNILDTPPRRGGPRMDHVNPQTTRDQEIQPERLTPKAKKDMRVHKLVAVWDQNGNPMVAMTINGNRVEAFRAPTKDEWNALRERGQIVKQPQSFGDATPAPPSGLTPWLIGGAVLAALAAGVWAYKSYSSEDNQLDDDADEI